MFLAAHVFLSTQSPLSQTSTLIRYYYTLYFTPCVYHLITSPNKKQFLITYHLLSPVNRFVVFGINHDISVQVLVFAIYFTIRPLPLYTEKYSISLYFQRVVAI